MGKYTNTISSYSSDRTQINSALSEKLSDSVDVKFSEIPDKIRAIEVGSGYKVIVQFDYYENAEAHYVSFQVRENNSSGAILVQENDYKSSPTQTEYKYSFETEADSVYVSSDSGLHPKFEGGGGMDTWLEPSPANKTLTDLKKHRTILIKADEWKSPEIEYGD